MSYIRGTETALPEKLWQKEEIIFTAKKWLENSPEKLSLFQKFLQNTGNTGRGLCLTPSQLIELAGLKKDFAAKRAAVFREFGVKLALEAAEKLLNNSGLKKDEIDALVFTSCSYPTIPSIDGEIISKIGLRADITRIPIYQYGCAGGVAGIALAHKISDLGNVMLISSELCSLVFYLDQSDVSDLVAAAIFGDGAAATLISNLPDKNTANLRIISSKSYLIPNSTHLMGYEPTDFGPKLLLSRELPSLLEKNAKKIVADFLNENQLVRESISHWLFHPGGSKIVDTLRKELNVTKEQSWYSDYVLENFGNMSSATVLFVMNEFLNSKSGKQGEKVVMLGIGPGLSVELVLFEMR